MYLVSGWSSSNFGANLQGLKPDRTHIISYRNVISIENMASAVVVVFFFGLFCRSENGSILYGLVKSV